METNVKQGVEQAAAVQPEVTIGSYDAIIKGIIANGGKKLNGIRVKNVNFDEKDNYTMVSFTLSEKIPGFVQENGVYKEGMTNVVFTSMYAIAGALKEDEEKAWLANHLLAHPKALCPLFAGAIVDIVQQKVEAGTPYSNPFSTRADAETSIYDHDIIINNVIRFKFGKMGEKAADKLMNIMLDE